MTVMFPGRVRGVLNISPGVVQQSFVVHVYIFVLRNLCMCICASFSLLSLLSLSPSFSIDTFPLNVIA